MRRYLYPVFLHCVLVALSATTLVLVNHNQRLEAMIAPAEAQLEIGTSAQPIEVESLNGKRRTLGWGAQEPARLLLVFTTSCPACAQNQEAWSALHSEVDSRVEILGISLDRLESTRAYRDAHGMPFDVLVSADRDAFAASYEISSVPSTLLISSDGRVQGVWRGVLSDERRAVASSTRRDSLNS